MRFPSSCEVWMLAWLSLPSWWEPVLLVCWLLLTHESLLTVSPSFIPAFLNANLQSSRWSKLFTAWSLIGPLSTAVLSGHVTGGVCLMFSVWSICIEAASSILSVNWYCAGVSGRWVLGRTLMSLEGSHRVGVQVQLWNLLCNDPCGVRPLMAQWHSYQLPCFDNTWVPHGGTDKSWCALCLPADTTKDHPKRHRTLTSHGQHCGLKPRMVPSLSVLSLWSIHILFSTPQCLHCCPSCLGVLAPELPSVPATHVVLYLHPRLVLFREREVRPQVTMASFCQLVHLLAVLVHVDIHTGQEATDTSPTAEFERCWWGIRLK